MTRIDPLDRLRAADPCPDLAVAPSRALREAILLDDESRRPVPVVPRAPRFGRRDGASQPIAVHKKRLIVGVVLAAVAAVTTTAAAVAYLDVRQSTQINCEARPDLGFGIDATTGDPVADCAGQWQSATGDPAPGDLVAYDSGQGWITVMPADRPAPVEWTRLPAGPVQDPRLIELNSALSDWVDGLMARCYSDAQATTITDRTLTRLGLTGWKADLSHGHADGRTSCARYVYTEPGEKKVGLDAQPPVVDDRAVLADPGQRWRQLPAQIREALATCRSLPDATDEITRLAAAIGYPVRADQLTIDQVPDPTATCTRADMVVGGSVRIILRGPAQ